MSGLNQAFAKRSYAQKVYRGFKSLPLRHIRTRDKKRKINNLDRMWQRKFGDSWVPSFKHSLMDTVSRQSHSDFKKFYGEKSALRGNSEVASGTPEAEQLGRLPIESLRKLLSLRNVVSKVADDSARSFPQVCGRVVIPVARCANSSQFS